MPNDAPELKVQATKEYGGHIFRYDRWTTDIHKMEAKFIEDNPGVRLVPSSNHKHIIAGQATVSKELFEEVGDLDYLFVCLGGGGLLAGASLAKSQLCPSCKLIGVEP